MAHQLVPPDGRHEETLRFLPTLLGVFVRNRGLGKACPARFEMRLRDRRSYCQPDIMFVANEHLDRLTQERLDGPADLVVEIVGDDTADQDLRVKPVKSRSPVFRIGGRLIHRLVSRCIGDACSQPLAHSRRSGQTNVDKKHSWVKT